MSRIGKKPIIIEPDIQISINNEVVNISGSKGGMDVKIPRGVSLEKKENQLLVVIKNNHDNNLQGLTRSLIQNAVKGVKSGWTKQLEMVGVGYRSDTDGMSINLHVGFSHVVKIQAPKGISFQVTENKITVSGIDKYLVGEVAASIRRVRPPEPYKGKGIKYMGEHIRKKLGKAAKAVGGA
ncbi:50S ribosomal protein L6, partial [Candidatus Gottesmanbacteria bacterium CG1_02_37_22]